MSERVRSYRSGAIEVRFEPRRCIHSAECVFGLPVVFDPGRRPWIEPGAAGADSIARVVAHCPTGALHFERLDGGPAEAPDPVNRVRVMRNGPLYVRGSIELRAHDGSVVARDVRVALCRCGASKNKPFCDNSHLAAGFADAGELPEAALEPAEGTADRTLRVTTQANGPYRIEGPLEIRSATGRARAEGAGAELCRCGGSRRKPFCDGSHREHGFEAPG